MTRQSGAIAQLGERLNGIQEVSGSIPLGSTIPLNYFSRQIGPARPFSVVSDVEPRCFAEGHAALLLDAPGYFGH